MVYIGSNFECSKTLLRNAGELTDKTKICSKNRHEISSSPNYRLNVHFESLSSTNIAQTFAWNETVGVTKLRRFIAAIALLAKFRRKAGKSEELCRNLLALLLQGYVCTVQAPLMDNS